MSPTFNRQEAGYKAPKPKGHIFQYLRQIRLRKMIEKGTISQISMPRATTKWAGEPLQESRLSTYTRIFPTSRGREPLIKSVWWDF